MAGEWIAMNCDLWTSPEVVSLSAFCQQHVSAARSRASSRCIAIGALFRFWSIVDIHCDDGTLLGYTTDELDLEIGIEGFAQALAGVGWLVPCAQGVEIPGFEKWFSRSARRRRLNATYQRESRKRRQQSVSTCADKKLTTEQNRREQNNKKKTPLPPSIPEALNTPEFCAAWESWQKHRREIKHPLTGEQSQKQLAKFLDWGVPRSISAISHTITQGWTGLREPEAPAKNGSHKQQRTAAAEKEFLNADSQ